MILVLGSTGFLGANVCQLLERNGIEYAGASLSTGVDLRKFVYVDELFGAIKPNVVINCASYVGGLQFGLAHPTELFTNNLKMALNIYQALEKHSIPKIINPISNCTYPGSACLFKVDEWWDGPMHDSVLIYGFTKKALWVASQAYKKEFGIISNNIILPNMYGIGDHKDELRAHALGALITKFVKAKVEGNSQVTVWGTGAPVREWLNVLDGAEALFRSIPIELGPDPINVGRGEGISIKDLAYKIREIVGVDCEIIFDLSKPDGAPTKTIDGITGTRKLGWSPEIDLDLGLRNTISSYLKEVRTKN
jgi:GDP-L-fucose synthase